MDGDSDNMIFTVGTHQITDDTGSTRTVDTVLTREILDEHVLTRQLRLHIDKAILWINLCATGAEEQKDGCEYIKYLLH